MIKEKIGGGDTLRFRAAGGVTQINYELLRSLFLQITNVACDFLRLAFGKRVHLDVADVVGEHFFADRRDGDHIKRSYHLLRFGSTGTADRHSGLRSDLPSAEAVNLSKRQ